MLIQEALVQVNELVFPADFYVLDMEDEGSPMLTPLLLGRPFMKQQGQRLMSTMGLSIWSSMEKLHASTSLRL